MTKRYIGYVFVICCALVMDAAPKAAMSQVKTNAPPNNAESLLENVLRLVGSRELSNPESYTDANLHEYFGGRPSLSTSTAYLIGASIEGAGDCKMGDCCARNLNLKITREGKGGGYATLYIGFFPKNGITESTLSELLRQRGVSSPTSNPDRVITPSATPGGNVTYRYQLNETDYAVAQFGMDASLESLSFYQSR